MISQQHSPPPFVAASHRTAGPPHQAGRNWAAGRRALLVAFSWRPARWPDKQRNLDED